MPDPIDELATARDHLDPRWTPARAQRALGVIEARLSRPRVRLWIPIAAAAAAAVLLAFSLRDTLHIRFGAGSPSAANSAASPLSSADALSFADGSTARALRDDTRLMLHESNESSVVVSVESGAAKFSVTHRPERVFSVRIGAVTLRVLGTVFEVDRQATTVTVRVTEGRVQVDSVATHAVVGAGQSVVLSLEPAPVASASVGAAAPTGSVVEPLDAKTDTKVDAKAHWRALARAGRHGEAYAAVKALGPQGVDDAEGLLAAADVAKLAGRPGEAVPFLERVLRDFRTDSRAAIAAFSLGKIQMNSSPALAAARFSEARTLAPSSALAEDALAREADAWALAGARDKASSAARLYLQRYPTGQRVDAMRRYSSP